MDRTPNLIWMKARHEINVIAPWIFGSTIFHRENDNLFDTFEHHPIDAFYGTVADYEKSDNQQKENKTQLKQLFSSESIDPETKARWHSLTNLRIHDG